MHRQVIATNHRELADYAAKLVEDLTPHDMVAQPIEGVTMNHPAWILAHLGAYGPVLAAILKGDPVEDPMDHQYGRNSHPLPDPDAYPSKEELLANYLNSYGQAAELFLEASDTHLARPTPIERWLTRFPTIAYLPPQFLVKHNATHLGQLSAWRRAGGRPAV